MSYKIESNIFMGDFDTTIQNPTTSTGGITNGGGTAPAGTGKPSIEDIFNRKLTRAQVAQEFGQTGLDLFDKANTDGEDGISKKEMDAYNNPEAKPDDLTSKSGKRTAPGGVYTVVKGDTLSKIANDFGIDLYVLYTNNKSTIGNNMNVIQIGQKINISAQATGQDPIAKEQKTEQKKSKELILSDKSKSALSEYFGTDLTKLSGQELAQKATKIKIGQLNQALHIVMENSNKQDLENLTQAITKKDTIATTIISTAKKLDDPKKAEKFMQDLSNAVGEDVTEMSVEDLMTKISTMGSEQKGKVLKCVIKDLGDSEIHHPELKEGQEITEEVFDNFYKIDRAKIEKEQDPDKRTDMYARAIAEKIKEDRDLNNANSYINKAIADIRSGHLTEDEKRIYRDSKLDETTIMKIAEQRIRNAHSNLFADAMISDITNGNYEEFMKHVAFYTHADVQASYGEDTKDSGQIAVLVSATAEASDTPSEYKTRMSNVLATKSKELGVNELDDDYFRAITKTVQSYADKDSLEQYNIDNANRAEIIREEAQEALNNTTDPDRKSILEGVVKSTTSIINNGGQPRTETQNNHSYETQRYSTSSIREESQRYYANLGITSPTTAEEVEQQQSRQSVNKLKTEIGPAPVIYSPARIKQLSRDYNNTIGKFDTLSKEEQEAVKKYLNNAKGQPQAIISIMLAGNEKVQLFLVKEKYITIEDITRNIKSFPANYDGLADTIKDALHTNVKTSVIAGTLKPEQMTDGERKMYEYAKQD